MRRKWIAGLLSAAVVLSLALPAAAEALPDASPETAVQEQAEPAVQEEEAELYGDDATCTIEGCDESASVALTIPEKIAPENHGTDEYQMTSIGESAFNGGKSLSVASNKASASITSSVPKSYSNEINDKIPSIYGKCRTSFLGELDDGGYQTVVFCSGVLYIDNYDADWNFVESKTVALELPSWGGIYLGKKYNYVVCGQSYDSELDDGGEVYRVIKYDKNFRRIDSISFSSAETYTAQPFYSGNVSIDESGNHLIVYTSRLRLDGHQSNIALRINTEDMTVADSYGMVSFPDVHVSHSFRQIVKYDGDTPVYVDLSDGAPVRSIYLQYDHTKMPLVKISGINGDNVTNAEVSGLEISDTHYFVVGTYLNYEEQNVYLSCIDKETAEATTLWLTSATAFSPQTLYAPRITKIAEDRFVVMWNVAGTNSIQYLILNGAGNIICAQKQIYGVPSADCEPIFSHGKIIWLSIKNGIVRIETLTDFSEVGTYKQVSPIIEAVNPWDGVSDTSWYREENTVFSISTPQQLAGLSELTAEGNNFRGKTVNLKNDLFMNDDSYTYDWPSISTWEGTFNGNGHTIYNILQDDESGGLFQAVGENGIVKAVTLAQGIFGAGGCIADVNQGIIAFCSSRSLVYGDDDYSGAICDVNKNLVYGCKNYGTVIGESVAGIVGINKESTSVVSQCSNLGKVAGIHEVSGIIEFNIGWVYNNYSSGLLSSMIPGNLNEAKTLAGIADVSNYKGHVESCYNIGTFSYNENTSFLLYAISAYAINSYTQHAYSGDKNAVTVLSANEMRSASFVDLLNQQTHTVLPAWVRDTELINDGYPITVADYNYQRGVYKIQPELWLGLKSKTVRLKPGESESVPCASYYNEEDMMISVTNSTVANVTLSEETLKIEALRNGETYLNIHFNETENVIAADYQIRIIVDSNSGYCGNDATWSFDEATGVLSIEGTGPMSDYYNSYYSPSVPWDDYCDQIHSVQIADKITSIGKLAFSGCNSLTSVTIPKSVTIIGDSAFEGSNSLTDVYYSGSESDRAKISIGSDNAPLVSATWHYGSTGPTPTPKPTVKTTPMYRLYNPNSGEHFYTGSIEERDNLSGLGWNSEGEAWNAPTNTGTPVYRMFNPNSGDHHYTMSQQEVEDLKAIGWRYEGVAWNSAEPTAENVPQFRLYNPNADCGCHHYTSSEEERDNLVALGWNYEGLAWYGTLK